MLRRRRWDSSTPLLDASLDLASGSFNILTWASILAVSRRRVRRSWASALSTAASPSDDSSKSNDAAERSSMDPRLAADTASEGTARTRSVAFLDQKGVEWVTWANWKITNNRRTSERAPNTQMSIEVGPWVCVWAMISSR